MPSSSPSTSSQHGHLTPMYPQPIQHPMHSHLCHLLARPWEPFPGLCLTFTHSTRGALPMKPFRDSECRLCSVCFHEWDQPALICTHFLSSSCPSLQSIQCFLFSWLAWKITALLPSFPDLHISLCKRHPTSFPLVPASQGCVSNPPSVLSQLQFS